MVAAFWRGRITLRKLRVSVEGLPPDSALHRAYQGHSWTRDSDWLMADVVDTLRALLVLTRNVNRGEHDVAMEPLPPVDRPVGAGQAEADAEQARAEQTAMRSIILQLLPGSG